MLVSAVGMGCGIVDIHLLRSMVELPNRLIAVMATVLFSNLKTTRFDMHMCFVSSDHILLSNHMKIILKLSVRLTPEHR